MAEYKVRKFPRSRVATIDVFAVGLRKHHVAALIEMDVTAGREKLDRLKEEGHPISFTAWLIKVISCTIKDHELVAGYLKGKREVVVFNDINLSIVVEKDLNGQKVPIPLVIEKANERSVGSIATQINDAREKVLTEKDIVLQRRSAQWMKAYYRLPGFLRRLFWSFLLKNPHQAFSKMGNVAFTSVGMIGNVNGWFVPSSVHPICFGIGRVMKKPVVVDDRIEIREILNLTILMDHDVVDGAPMARFVTDLSDNIGKGFSSD